MRIENRFEVPLPVAQTWRLLLDVPSIASCVPGASLTEVVDEHTYRGTATVKVGPVQLVMAGRAVLEEIDEATHSATVRGEGNDAKGRGGAKAVVRFRLEPAGSGTAPGTLVSIATDPNLSGTVAQYGRASGLIGEIANQIVAQFSANLHRRIAETQGAAAPVSASASADAASATAPVPAGDAGVPALRLLFRAVLALLGRWISRRTPGTAGS